MNFAIKNGAYVSINRDLRASAIEPDDEDGDSISEYRDVFSAISILIWDRDGRHGFGYTSIRNFNRLRPYWALLEDAANSGDKASVIGLLSRQGFG
jgi:hypothetical protein